MSNWFGLKTWQRSLAHLTLFALGASAVGGIPTGTARQTDYLQIANGRRIYYAEDILPVVDPASPAAVAAKEANRRAIPGARCSGSGWAASWWDRR